MRWYLFKTPEDPALTELAHTLHLHPLHMEDARNPGERAKVEAGPTYTFALLRTLTLPAPEEEPIYETISIFASRPTDPATVDEEPFFIVIADTSHAEVAGVLRRAESECQTATPGRLLYLVFDSIVDSYFPGIDALDDQIDILEDRVVTAEQDLLNDLFAVKRQLVSIRRLLVSTRDACMHLQRDAAMPLDNEHQLYLRDLYDHVARLLDTVESQRDMLNNALDIYLSSVAQRTNEVMKVLTVLSTIALPSLVVTGIYGMNIRGLPLENSPYAVLFVVGLTMTLTVALLVLLRRLRWI